MAIQINGVAVTDFATATYNGFPLNKVLFGGRQVWPEGGYDDPFTLTNLSDEAITWKWTAYGSPSPFTFLYSNDGGVTWVTGVAATSGAEYALPAGGSVEIVAGASSLGSSGSDYWSLSASGAHSASGDVMSLLGYAGAVPGYGLYYLFYGDAGLVDASMLTLPAATLGEECYRGMFSECTSLANGPASIQATALAQYCCRGMFWGCTSLTGAPELPATTLAYGCYFGMFGKCTSLAAAPDLAAATLADYCYDQMFSGCTGLGRVKCLATDVSARKCTVDWLTGVGDSGTFVKAPGMTGWTNGVSGIPSGWTVEDAE